MSHMLPNMGENVFGALGHLTQGLCVVLFGECSDSDVRKIVFITVKSNRRFDEKS